MNRYIEWGHLTLVHGEPRAQMEHAIDFDPTNIESFKDIWAALPPDLRLAMAKTAPKVAGKWKGDGVIAWREVNGEPYAVAGRTRVDGYFRIGSAPMQDVQATALDLIQAACDAALIAQGYVLDGDAP